MSKLEEKIKSTKNKKGFKLFILFILSSFLNVYFAFFLHQFAIKLSDLSRGKLSRESIKFSLNMAIQTYKLDKRIYIWFLILEALVVVGFLLLSLRPTYELANIKEYSVTDNIKIPVPAGNGQYGKSWFMCEEDKKRLLKELRINSSEQEFSGEPGIILGYEKNGDVDKIRYFKDFTHSMIVALTGAGKTRRIVLESICLQIMFGKCIVVSDIKGEIFYYTKDFAKQHRYKTIVLDLNSPEKSNCYNFLQPVLDALEEGKREKESRENTYKNDEKDIKMMLKNKDKLKEKEYQLNDYSWTGKAQERAWDIVSALVGEPKGEPLWTNGEASVLCSAILSLCIEAPEECRNFHNLYMFLAYMTQMDKLLKVKYLDLFLEDLPDTHPAKIVFMQSQVAASKTRDSFYTSALATLRLFTIPSLAQMSASSEFSIDDIGVKEKTILYLVIPDEKKTYYSLASLFINQLYIAQVESARKNGGTLPISTIYDLDELGNFPLIPSLPNIATAGRSRGAILNLILQDYEQLKKVYKEDTETIKSQCGLKILLKSDSIETLKDMSEKIGEYTIESVSASTSANTSSSTLDSNISNSSNLVGRKLLKVEELAKLKEPFALAMITGEAPLITKLPDLTKYNFNTYLGLGDKEHNNRKIYEIENARPKRKISQVPVWGIWNKYKLLCKQMYEKMKEETEKKKAKGGDNE